MARQKRITAAELMARLQSDPEWVRQDAERERLHREFDARLAVEEQPLLADLAEAGHKLRSVWDLVNTSKSYPTAVPVLLKHLGSSYHPRIDQGIVRALTVREARGIAGRAILDRLSAGSDPIGSEIRWLLANALTVIADATLRDELKKLAADPAFEDVHERLRVALKKLR